jgi:hypothetical protein
MGDDEVVRTQLRVRDTSRRSVDDRFSLRFAGLYRFLGAAVMRLPRRSRLRRALLRRFARLNYQAFNRRDLDCISGRVSVPDSEFHVVVSSDLRLDFDDIYRGLDGLRRIVEVWDAAWADLQLEPRELIDLGDGRILVLADMVGRGRGSGIELREQFAHLLTLRGAVAVREEFWLGSWNDALRAAGLPGSDG